MRTGRRDLLCGLAQAVAGLCPAAAQEASPPQVPNYSVGVEVVQVLASVRDPRGAIVKDLTREDFLLREDGREQTIRYFARETDLPLTIGLLVDTTPSESNMLSEERKASMAFLERMLRPEKDKAFLIQYHSEIELLQDLTSSRAKLEAAMNRLEAHGMAGMRGSRGGGGPTGGPGSARPGMNPTALSDAVYLASEEVLKTQSGRKTLLVLGDGGHLGDRGEQAIAAALEADALIYSIRIYDKNFAAGGGPRIPTGRIPGMGGPGRRPGTGPSGRGAPGVNDHAQGKENLQKLSSRTGGGYFEVGKKETLDRIYAQIEEELRSQYSLGYTPEGPAGEGYRRIQVAVRRSGLSVKSREGYYSRRREAR